MASSVASSAAASASAQQWAIVLNAAKLTAFETATRAAPSSAALGPKDALVAITRVGICGSDVHYWKHGSCGPFKIADGASLVLGHESAGRVLAVGAEVRNVAVGDRVAIEAGFPCRTCRLCRSGQYNLCPKMSFHGTPPIDGTLQQFVTHPADFLYTLPPNVSDEEAAMLEPLNVAVNAADRAHLCFGHSVLVLGAGPIGLVLLLTALSYGASPVIIADINQQRLDFAAKLGGLPLSSADAGNNPAAFAEQVRALVDKHGVGDQRDHSGVDVTFEASGAQSAIRAGIYSTRSGGKFVSIGRGAGAEVNAFPLFDAADREVDILGVFRYRNMYNRALALVASGRIDVRPLITHHFNMPEQCGEAFDVASTGRDGAIKVMLCFPEATAAAQPR